MLDFDFSSMLYRIPALLIAITIHEYAHAQTAEAMGDPTPRFMGRLTFNPLAHLDPIGALMLIVAGFGWAKPVGINPNNFRNRREGILKGVYSFLLWTQLYNVWFAFFNLIPIPPLDGSKILGELLPPRTAYQYENMVGQYGFYILLALVFTGIVGMIIRPLASTYMSLVNSILGIVF